MWTGFEAGRFENLRRAETASIRRLHQMVVRPSLRVRRPTLRGPSGLSCAETEWWSARSRTRAASPLGRKKATLRGGKSVIGGCHGATRDEIKALPATIDAAAVRWCVA